ncbi:MAG: imidazoleglycerol-phosphate dehydratase HisB [Clostridia bacterium]|nr:imidazoleglycerol-phosphate dehydratase HisB [Clostridia bacterium]
MRCASISRKTNETDINLELNIDGTGKRDINTGIGFFDHMLDLLAAHALFDLKVTCAGDVFVDAHHSVEDVGIALGQAINKALGDRRAISRYATFFLPMDESLANISIDISGRPYLKYDVSFKSDRLGEMDTQLVEEFFRALVMNAQITLHIRLIYGSNDHHKAEAIFKGFGRAIRQAAKTDGRIIGIPSTKGIL